MVVPHYYDTSSYLLEKLLFHRAWLKRRLLKFYFETWTRDSKQNLSYCIYPFLSHRSNHSLNSKDFLESVGHKEDCKLFLWNDFDHQELCKLSTLFLSTNRNFGWIVQFIEGTFAAYNGAKTKTASEKSMIKLLNWRLF